MRTGSIAVAGLCAVGLTITACSSGTSTSSSGTAGAAGANAGVGKVHNASDVNGGTLRFAITEDWDSVDPGDTYYGLSWNFLRNYARTLVTFKGTPDAPKLVPDLATSLGKPSDNATTWTYTLRDGLKFQDGTPITSTDIKYAIARQLDKGVFPNGPTYFGDLLKDVPKGYSVYKTKDLAALTSIQTPDAKTIVFKLAKPFASFDAIAQLPATAPVPAAKDTGAKYKQTIVSSGPYKFESYQAKKRYVLVRNENYDPATDPESGRKPLPDKLTVDLGVNGADLDQQLLAGTLDVDLAGSGVQTQTQAQILNNADLKANTDLAASARTWFSVIPSDVITNIDCRKAIVHAISVEGYQRAYGGETGGEIATSLLPPMIPGHVAYDPFGKKAAPQGDPAKAKEALAACGKPNGFETNIAYRADRQKEKATAESMQQSLSKAGIKASLKGYPTGDYFKLYAGKPDFVKANNLGILVYGWQADWPDGFGFLQQIVDSRSIRPAGNTNLGIKIPAVDQMIDKALVTIDEAARNTIWGDIDKAVIDNASVIPGVWAKGLLYRPPYLTNVFVNPAWGEYDYAAIGTSKK
ncbi:MAG TPA: ABC transporter substrate-binding protein [Dermatophilaceae bacterium]|nr:ABC transporter substrate-binding protein [Dermatophilaceae bacterium]